MGSVVAITIEMDDALEQRTDALAEALDRTPTSLLSAPITQFLDRHHAQHAFALEAEASWTDYQATGLHLTGVETRAWLARWGDEADIKPPECHG